jgi:VHL beta domain
MYSSFRSTACALFLMAAFATSATADSCALEGRIKSKNSNKPVTVTFENGTGGLRNVTWLDFNGNPVDYAQLQPGEKFTVKTFVTHPWMFPDGPGNCHEIFMPKKNIKKFRITVERQGLGD